MSKNVRNELKQTFMKYPSIINSTMLPCLHFGMNCQCFAASTLTWPGYDDDRKRENSSV